MAFNIFGTIDPPNTNIGYEILGPDTTATGPFKLLANLLFLITTISGIFVLINFIMAGYLYLSSNGNPQKISAAGNKMLKSLIGLVIIAAAFIIAGLIGLIFFEDPSFLIRPRFYTLIDITL